MGSIAVQLTQPDGESMNGVLVSSPMLGQDCRIYTGTKDIFRVMKIRGWLGLAESNTVILFDYFGRRFRMEKIASSSEFLL